MKKVESTNSIVTNAVAIAYLSITQDITQGILSNQILQVNCNNTQAKEYCLECTNYWLDYNKNNPNNKLSTEQINSACDVICTCNLDNITMDQQITVDFTSYLVANSEHFEKLVLDNIAQQAVANDTTVSLGVSKSTINDLYTAIRSNTTQESLQGLETLQIISLSGPGSLVHVDMKSAINYVSNVLITNTETRDIMKKLSSEVAKTETSVSDIKNSNKTKYTNIVLISVIVILLIIALLVSI